MLWIGGLIASYLTARAQNWPLIYGVAVVFGLYLLATGGGAGITGAVGSVVGGVSNFVNGIRRMALSVVIFVGLMLPLNRFMGVGFDFVGLRFRVLGVAFWGYPAHMDLSVIMWVCAAFLIAGVASRAAAGNTTLATRIFAVSFAVCFVCVWLPNYAATYPTAAEIDDTLTTNGGVVNTVAEEGGAVSIVATKTGTLLAGKPKDLKEHGIIGSSFRRFWAYAFGEDAPKPPAPPAPTVVYVPAPTAPVHVAVRKQYVFASIGGCAVTPYMRGEILFYPKGGWVTITPPLPATPWHDAPGITNTEDGKPKPEGVYTICPYDKGNGDSIGTGIDVIN